MNNVFVVVRMSVMKLRLCGGLAPHERLMPGLWEEEERVEDGFVQPRWQAVRTSEAMDQ